MKRPAKLGARDSDSKRLTMALMGGSPRPCSWQLCERVKKSALSPALSPGRGRRSAVVSAAIGDVLGDVAADFGGRFLGMAFDFGHVRHAAAEAAFEGPVRVHVFGVFHGDWGI